MASERLTTEQLEELERLEKAATPGPLRASPQIPSGNPRFDWKDHIEADNTPLGPRAILFSPNSNLPDRYAEADAQLLATLRNSAKALIATARREAKYREALEKIREKGLDSGRAYIVELARTALEDAR